jgi:ribosome recycling factor
MLSNIEVDYYGTSTPLQQLASVSTPDAQTLLINVYDKTCLEDVERAIMESDLGLTPNNTGEVCYGVTG